ncbi:MAG: sigma-E factor negative regulatory protein RseB, partial [Granulosicoccus sp.]
MALPSMSNIWLRASVFSMGCAIAAGMSVVPAVWAGAEQRELDPANLVREMSMALKMLNYEGKFVHVQGSNVTAMHIIHSSDSKGELERLISLDGEAREVIRNNS